MSVFGNVPVAPPDGIFGVATKYNASKLPNKHLLSVGVYQTEDGKPYVFPAVSAAEDRIIHKYNKNYLPMTGFAPFVEKARELLWGPVLPQIADRLASVQSAAGTGALFLVSRIAKNRLNFPAVFISDPTWPNYNSLFGENMGHKIMRYPWINKETLELNLEGTLKAFKDAPEGCLLILQGCAHNPSGVDPTPEQWKEIFKVAAEKKHTICFDFAYMGFASGNMDTDASVIREFATTGTSFFVCFSFSKIMGLYGERVGVLHAVCQTPEEAVAMKSQMAAEVRGSISVCPQNGAYIAYEVLNDPELKAQWLKELDEVTHRIINIRNKFVDLLNAKTPGKTWEHIRKQHGMFALTGLNPEQVAKLGDEQGVFIPGNGRISVPALNNGNVDAVAQAVANIANAK